MGNCGTGDGKRPPGGQPTTVGEATGQSGAAMPDRHHRSDGTAASGVYRGGRVLEAYQNPGHAVAPVAEYQQPPPYHPASHRGGSRHDARQQHYQQQQYQQQAGAYQGYQTGIPVQQDDPQTAYTKRLEKRVKALRVIFPMVDADTIRDVVGNCPDDEDLQVQTLSEMNHTARSMRDRGPGTAVAAPRNSVGGYGATPPAQHLPLFQVNARIEALFDQQYHPGMISEIHPQGCESLPAELRGPCHQYTVKWDADGTITLVPEQDVRPRQMQ